jgi:hypothetical protein
MRMNGREVVWSCKRGFVKASGLKERVCRSEVLSVVTLRDFEVRWKRNVNKGSDNNPSRPCIKKGWEKDLAGELRRSPLDNGVHCQRRGSTRATCETFGQDDGHAVQNTTHL